jgi:hypothetical protein
MGSVQSGYKEVFGRTEWVAKKWRIEFRDASLQGYKFGSRGIELSWQLAE